MHYSSSTIHHAEVLWNYLSGFRSVETSDVTIVCCSYDLRICDFACNTLKEGKTKRLIFSGNTGNWTNKLWHQKECDVFRERAIQNGICPTKIVTEDRATNIGENIAYSKDLVPTAEIVTFITKQNTILRVKLTQGIVWPEITAHYDAPNFIFPEQVSNIIGLFGLISEMVGDIQRIQEYPKLGYQSPIELPKPVIKSWNYLINNGFTQHLL